MSTNHEPERRLLTNQELALLIKMLRQDRGWSQEQLADISRLIVRTIQRIEQDAPSSFDTRRSVVKAFGFADIDVLNRPMDITTEEQIISDKKRFESESIVLDVLPLATGRQLAQLVENSMIGLVCFCVRDGSCCGGRIRGSD